MLDIFDTSTTDMSFYDKLLRDGKGIEIGEIEVTAEIVYMTPDDYFERCAKLNKSTIEEQYKMIDEDNMQKLMSVIEYEKLPIGFLNYASKGQEGRHRALLSKRLGLEFIPVLIIKKLE